MNARNSSSTLRRWEAWAMVAILLLATALRLIGLADMPPGLRYDELLNHQMAGRVLAGERPLYFSGSWGHEPLFHYVQAATIALAGTSDWSLRLPAALGGLLSVLAAWLAARRLFGPRVAILTGAGLAVSFWSIFHSRQGLRAIAITPLSCLMVTFLWRGLERPPEHRRRAMADFAVAGVCLGSALYIYMAARALPALPVALAFYLALFQRARFKRAWPGMLVLVIVGALVAAPLLTLLITHPELEQRSAQMVSAWAALREGDVGPVLHLAVRALGLLLWRGEEDWLYNVYGRPVFDPVTALGFVLGLVLSARRWRQARFALLLLWLGVGIGPATIIPPPASLIHAIAAQPPAYIVLAVGVAALARLAQRRWASAGTFLSAAIVALHGTLSCHAYFVTWAGAPEVWVLYQGGVTAVARELDAHDPSGPVAVGAPYVNYWHPWNAVGFDLALRREDLDVRWFNPAGGWVWPAGSRPTTYYFPSDPLGPQSFAPALKALFLADATLLPPSGAGYAAFRVARPAALEEQLNALAGASLAWPPDLAHLPPPTLPLAFGDRFALLGVELEQATVSAGGELRLTTYWQVLAADPSPVVAFVHLTSDGHDIWGQHDWLDVRTAGLQAGDRFAQVHVVPVEPETAPGLYHLQLGLYHPDTPLRLPVATGTLAAADRVWLEGEVRVSQ